MSKIEEILIKLRVFELESKPSFGALLIKQDLNENTSWCKSFSTDGNNWFYNPNYVKNFKSQNVLYFMYHSLLHCILGNLIPEENHEEEIWDIASDIEVVLTSIHLNLGTPPKEILDIIPSINFLVGKSTKEIYEIIKNNYKDYELIHNDIHLKISKDYEEFNINDYIQYEEDEEGDLKGESNQKSEESSNNNEDTEEDSKDESDNGSCKECNNSNDEESDSSGDSTESSNEESSSESNNDSFDQKPSDSSTSDDSREDQQEVDLSPRIRDDIPVVDEDKISEINKLFKSQLMNFPNHERDLFPGNMNRLITEYTEPKLDWKSILTNTMSTIFDKDDYNFNKPSKRSYSLGKLEYILPSQAEAKTIDICVSLDTSGSITDEIFMDFLTEVQSIIENYNDYKLHIWCIDSEIYCPKIFTPDNINELSSYQFVGGGGNDFPLNWEFMKDNDIVPELFVVFSDGYPCSEWGWNGYCETIFVIRNEYENITAPFGTTIQMIDNGKPEIIDPHNNGFIEL